MNDARDRINGTRLYTILSDVEISKHVTFSMTVPTSSLTRFIPQRRPVLMAPRLPSRQLC